MTMHDIPDQMRIYLALASWRSWGARTGWCYSETARYLSQHHDVDHEAWADDAMLERTRSRTLTRFREQRTEDVLLWVDSDMVWPIAAAERLAQTAYRTRGIAGAVYSKRGFGKGVTTRFARNEDTPQKINIGDDMLLPAELLGAGFMAIHRDALDAIAPTLPWVRDDINRGVGDWQPYCKTELRPLDDGLYHFVAEDEALCLHARRCGVPLICDVSIVLGHEGEHIYTVADGERRG